MNNLIGQKFGRLTVLHNSGEKSNNGQIIWVCICICGHFKSVPTSNLTSGNTKSCGCFKIEQIKKANIGNKYSYKHGDTKKGNVRLYTIWSHMKERCTNKNNKKYKRYGGRGIEICNEWKNNFINFKKWALANDYKNNLTIDRIDNDGNYEPSNCQFIPLEENSRKGGFLRWEMCR